jgi:hypothetical protein
MGALHFFLKSTWIVVHYNLEIGLVRSICHFILMQFVFTTCKMDGPITLLPKIVWLGGIDATFVDWSILDPMFAVESHCENDGSMTCCENLWNISACWWETKKLSQSLQCEFPIEPSGVPNFHLHVPNLFPPSRPIVLLWKEEEDVMLLRIYAILQGSPNWFVGHKRNS